MNVNVKTVLEQFWGGRAVWVSGATGSWGTRLCQRLLTLPIARLVAFCRGEHRAHDLVHGLNDDRVRVYLGDVRDRVRVSHSLAGVSVVIHTAALKRIDRQTYAPTEIADVNIGGTQAVIDGCITAGVERAFYISSDKAALPTTFYGATKLVAEQLWLSANDIRPTDFIAARFGNALGSQGSVLEIWRKQMRGGEPLTITDPEMTRFVITLTKAVRLIVEDYIPEMRGGELRLPAMPAVEIGALARAFAGPDYPIQVVGNRGFGEKTHELLSADGASSSTAPGLSMEWLREILKKEGLL